MQVWRSIDRELPVLQKPLAGLSLSLSLFLSLFLSLSYILSAAVCDERTVCEADKFTYESQLA